MKGITTMQSPEDQALAEITKKRLADSIEKAQRINALRAGQAPAALAPIVNVDDYLAELAADEPPDDHAPVAARRTLTQTTTTTTTEGNQMAQHNHESIDLFLTETSDAYRSARDPNVKHAMRVAELAKHEHVMTAVPSAMHGPGDATQGMLGRVAKRANYSPASAPASGKQTIDVTACNGRNSFERLMSHVQGRAGGKLSHDECFRAAVQLKAEATIVDNNGAQP
jgi:hypothetical protein